MNHFEGKPGRGKAKQSSKQKSRSRLIVRQVRRPDIDARAELSRRVYAPVESYSRCMWRAQLNNFPDGQCLAEYDDKIVGHCATFMISEKAALAPHTWAEITGQGLAVRHDEGGDVL